jgi:hypothetical protein
MEGSSELVHLSIQLLRDSFGWGTIGDCNCVKLLPDLHPGWSEAVKAFGHQCLVMAINSSPLERQSILPWAMEQVVVCESCAAGDPQNAFGEAELQRWLLRDEEVVQDNQDVSRGEES